MSVRMSIERDPELETGHYQAELLRLEKKQGRSMEWLSWSFYVSEHGALVEGVTTLSKSTQAEPYRWAKALNPTIAKRQSWGSEDVLGLRCTLVVEAHEDFRGRKRILVDKVEPPKGPNINREG